MHRFYKFLLLVLVACVLLSCEQERDNVSVDFIPGKPRPMQESLALADSMVVYNAQGLAYTTNSLKEIKKFAKAAVLDEETVDDPAGNAFVRILRLRRRGRGARNNGYAGRRPAHDLA